MSHGRASRDAIPARPPAARKPGLLERFLGLFTEVHAGEGGTALLLTVNVFLLLTAYYLIKPVREGFILQGGEADLFGWTVGKAELKSYASAGMALLLVGVVRAYGRLASAVPRQRLITWVTLFFISNLVVFYVLARTGVTAWIGLAFFLWVGIFNLMVVAQFWSFANDVYLPDEGKRLFPIVGFGASFGAVAGSTIAGWLIVVGEAQMLLVCGAVLVLCIVLTNVIHQREKRRAAQRARASVIPAPAAPAAGEDGGTPAAVAASAAEGAPAGANPPDDPERTLGRTGGFQLVLQDRYLLWIALLILVANIVNTTGEYILSEKVSRVAAAAVADGSAGGLSEGQYIGKFYSDFFKYVNILSLLLQLFVVSRILKYLGVRVALMVLPLLALGGYAILAAGASLGVIRLIKTLENATDYSLQNTTRNVLFLPTAREVKYKAKAAIDTFFVRTGDFVSALMVFVGTRLALSIENFALANTLLVVAWVALAVAIVRRYQRFTAAASPARPGSGD